MFTSLLLESNMHRFVCLNVNPSPIAYSRNPKGSGSRVWSLGLRVGV